MLVAAVVVVVQPAGQAAFAGLVAVRGEVVRCPETARAFGEEAGGIVDGRVAVGIEDGNVVLAVAVGIHPVAAAVGDEVDGELLHVAWPVWPVVGLEHGEVELVAVGQAVEGVDRYRRRSEGGVDAQDVLDDLGEGIGQFLGGVGRVVLAATLVGGAFQDAVVIDVEAHRVGGDVLRADQVVAEGGGGRVGLVHVLGQLVQAVVDGIATAVVATAEGQAAGLAEQRVDLVVGIVVGVGQAVGKKHHVVLAALVGDRRVVLAAGTGIGMAPAAVAVVSAAAVLHVLATVVEHGLVQGLGQWRVAGSGERVDRGLEFAADRVATAVVAVDVRHRVDHQATLAITAPAVAGIVVAAGGVKAHQADVDLGDTVDQLPGHALHDAQAGLRAGLRVVVVPAQVIGAVQRARRPTGPHAGPAGRAGLVGTAARRPGRAAGGGAVHALVVLALDMDRAGIADEVVGPPAPDEEAHPDADLVGVAPGLAGPGEQCLVGLVADQRAGVETITRVARRRFGGVGGIEDVVVVVAGGVAAGHGIGGVRVELGGDGDIGVHAARGVDDEQHVRVDVVLVGGNADIDLGVVGEYRGGGAGDQHGQQQGEGGVESMTGHGRYL